MFIKSIKMRLVSITSLVVLSIPLSVVMSTPQQPQLKVGDCVNNNGVKVAFVGVVGDECQNLQTCAPVQATCASMPLVGGCQFKITQAWLLVGQCQTIGPSFTCYNCSINNGTVFCMSYRTYSARNALGACIFPCANFNQFGGECFK
jgi:hypothetical protein